MGRPFSRIPAAIHSRFESLVELSGLGPNLTVFAILRGLVVLAAGMWLLFSPLSVQTSLVWWVFVAFAGYSLLLYALVLWRAALVPRLDLWVLAFDLAFCYLFVRLTGGTNSDFAPAFFLVASLQAYFYGLSRGLATATASMLLYLGTEWPANPSIHWTTATIRVGFLFLIAAALGVLAERERRQRQAILGLNQDLDQEMQRIQRITESIGDGIIVLDRQGRITDWNRAMEERYGITAAEVRGLPILESFPTLKAEGFEEVLARVLGGKEEVALEGFEHDTRHRGRVTVNIKGSFLRTPAGEVVGAVLVLEDVTEHIHLERIARQSEKMAAVGTLAAGIAHEINNPIGIITSRVELMLMEAREREFAPEVIKDLRVVEKHAGRVAKITQGLLSFSRQAPWTMTGVDVNQVVEAVLLLVEKQVAKEGITLKRDLARGLPKIQGSRNHLEQVVVNLLTNAREAMPGGGTLQVSTAMHGVAFGTERADEADSADRAADFGEPLGLRSSVEAHSNPLVESPSGAVVDQPGVEIRVSDSGPGIPPDVLPRIFDPFFTTKEQGTGLGLSITYGIVREHGGTITVESRPREGSTFIVQLPIPTGSRREGVTHGERAYPRH
ncbi:MAG: ATP-binding protein [Candidatus Methylomirabilales bacterium]